MLSKDTVKLAEAANYAQVMGFAREATYYRMAFQTSILREGDVPRKSLKGLLKV
jgi:hypothetical protein